MGGFGWSKPVKIHGFWGLRQLLWNRRKRLTKTWMNTWEIVGYWCPSLGWKVAFPTHWISRFMLVGRYHSETWFNMGSSWNFQLSQSLYIIVRLFGNHMVYNFETIPIKNIARLIGCNNCRFLSHVTQRNSLASIDSKDITSGLWVWVLDTGSVDSDQQRNMGFHRIYLVTVVTLASLLWKPTDDLWWFIWWFTVPIKHGGFQWLR